MCFRRKNSSKTVAVTCSSLQHCFLRDCWRVPRNKHKVFGDWERSGKTQSPFITEPELCCVVLERAQSDWGRDSACSFQEAEGRSWKAAAELLLHVNGHGQDLDLGFSKQKALNETEADFGACSPGLCLQILAGKHQSSEAVISACTNTCSLARQTDLLSGCMHIT